MKKQLIIACIFLISFSSLLNGQVVLGFNAESPIEDQDQCWRMQGITYMQNNTAPENEQPPLGRNSAIAAQSAWVKSPWFLPGSGNITLEAALMGTGGTSKYIQVNFITYNPNNTSNFNSLGDGNFITESVTYNWPSIETSIRTISFPLPTSITNSPYPYRMQMAFVGSGIEVNVKNLVIPGTYYSDPYNNCLALSNPADSDNDGINDNIDAYPNDATRAFNNYLVSHNFTTIMYEDLFPSRGDYDFNDLVVDVRVNLVSNGNNDVVEMITEVVPRAAGGSFKNGFAIHFAAIDPVYFISTTRSHNYVGTKFPLASNGFEAGINNSACLPVFDDIYKVLAYQGGNGGINTNPNVPTATHDTIRLVSRFNTAFFGPTDASGFLDAVRINSPFMIVNGDRSREVHPAYGFQTTKMNETVFNTFEAGETFLTNNGLPWALFLPQSIPYPTEKTDMAQAFLKFLPWAQSNGTQYRDWYMDKPGYRNTNNLYTR